MSWSAITEEEIWDQIIAAEIRMTFSQKRLWDVIKVLPHKWSLEPWGNLGGGFWVVGIIGCSVLWFNDIEEGFNISTYKSIGNITEYWCNQDELEHSVEQLLNLMNSSVAPYKCGLPQPL